MSKYQRSVVGSCNNVPIKIAEGVEEEEDRAYDDLGTVVLLYEASLDIRHWKSSCRWLAVDLQDSEDSLARPNTDQGGSTESEEQDDDATIEHLFGILKTRSHPLLATLRFSLDNVRRH
jgi:hypothetical protein